VIRLMGPEMLASLEVNYGGDEEIRALLDERAALLAALQTARAGLVGTLAALYDLDIAQSAGDRDAARNVANLISITARKAVMETEYGVPNVS
jgi:hypothetical protein